MSKGFDEWWDNLSGLEQCQPHAWVAESAYDEGYRAGYNAALDEIAERDAGSDL